MIPRPSDFEELVIFAMAHYDASPERAETIVTNHPDALRAEMEKANAEKETAPKEESSTAQTEKSDTPAE
jgi:hypothetical protein